MDKKQPL